MTTTDLMQTLGNPDWIKENEQRLKSIFPKTWTHFDNLDVLLIELELKFIDVNFSNVQELVNILFYLEKIGILLINSSFNVKANPRSIFDK